MGKGYSERIKHEERAQMERERAKSAKRPTSNLPAEVRSQLFAVGQVLEDELGRVLDAGESVRLIIEPTLTGGASFTLKTVQVVSETRYGVYLHGVVKHSGDVSEALRRVIQKGDWRVDKYWKP